MRIKLPVKLTDKKNIKLSVRDDLKIPSESTRKITDEGYLQATAAVTAVGVQMYSARDFGVDSDELIGVLRPPETVFHPETIDSLKMKPIVLLHPDYDVDSTNHSRLAVGSVGEQVEEISDSRLGAFIQITDESVVKKVLLKEIEELSLGYDTFVVSEQGSFNGETYLYRMDGPMIINHLAIVPEGRCGDTVKILDQGGKNVTKKQMIKALKDAGVSDDKIKLFMKDAKDSDKGDFDEYTKLLLAGKDIDMTALVPALVAELKPQMEELVKSPEFTSMLAKEIANGMSGGGGEVETDDQDQEEESAEMTEDMMDAAIKDKAESRSKLIAKAIPFVANDKAFSIYDAEDREILEKALYAVGVKAEDMKGKTDDYLIGILDSVSKDRASAQKFMSKDWGSDNGHSISRPLTGITARRTLK